MENHQTAIFAFTLQKCRNFDHNLHSKMHVAFPIKNTRDPPINKPDLCQNACRTAGRQRARPLKIKYLARNLSKLIIISFSDSRGEITDDFDLSSPKNREAEGSR